MTSTPIRINGQLLSDVRTRVRNDHLERSVIYVSTPDVLVRSRGDDLMLHVHPLTAVQLFYDGVLPQDRQVPVTVSVGRRDPSAYRLTDLTTQRSRAGQDVVVLSFTPHHPSTAPR